MARLYEQWNDLHIKNRWIESSSDWVGSAIFIITKKSMGWIAFLMSLEEKLIKFMIPQRMI